MELEQEGGEMREVKENLEGLIQIIPLGENLSQNR